MGEERLIQEEEISFVPEPGAGPWVRREGLRPGSGASVEGQHYNPQSGSEPCIL